MIVIANDEGYVCAFENYENYKIIWNRFKYIYISVNNFDIENINKYSDFYKDRNEYCWNTYLTLSRD